MRHPWWRTEAKLAIVFTHFFFVFFFYAFCFSPTSGKLPCLKIRIISRFWRHIFMLKFRWQTQNQLVRRPAGGLRVPPVVADGSKAVHCFHLLFFSVGLSLLLSFGSGALACATRGGGRSEAGHCFHLLFSFFLSSFFLFLSTPSAFHPLRGISRA